MIPILELHQVSHTYPDQRDAISDLSLSLEPGSFVALVGPSGIGKSTLLRIIARLLKPTKGTVTYPANTAANPPSVGIVFQQGNLMGWRTAAENIRLPLEINHLPPAKQEEQVKEMLELVGLSEFADYYPAQLSGGMIQRVAIARALITKPQLLLLDEPFGALDALTRERMGQELLRLHQTNPLTIFMVTHSIVEAILLADKVLVMNESPGKISQQFLIDLPRPRELSMNETAVFHQYNRQIREAIL